jgi:hypothetical protein
MCSIPFPQSKSNIALSKFEREGALEKVYREHEPTDERSLRVEIIG